MAMNSQPRIVVPAMSFKGQQISKKAMMMFLNQRGLSPRNSLYAIESMAGFVSFVVGSPRRAEVTMFFCLD